MQIRFVSINWFGVNELATHEEEFGVLIGPQNHKRGATTSCVFTEKVFTSPIKPINCSSERKNVYTITGVR